MTTWRSVVKDTALQLLCAIWGEFQSTRRQSLCWAEEEAEAVSVSKGRFGLDFSKTLGTNSVLLQIAEEGEDPFQDSL